MSGEEQKRCDAEVGSRDRIAKIVTLFEDGSAQIYSGEAAKIFHKEAWWYLGETESMADFEPEIERSFSVTSEEEKAACDDCGQKYDDWISRLEKMSDDNKKRAETADSKASDLRSILQLVLSCTAGKVPVELVAQANEAIRR